MADLSEGCANIYPVHDTYVFESRASKRYLTICDHAFESLIDIHVAGSSGWEGFLLQYHCFFPWEEAPWEIEDINELIDLLNTGLEPTEEGCIDKANSLKLVEFLKEMEKGREKVTVRKW